MVSGHLDWSMGTLWMSALAISVVLVVTAARLWVASIPDGKPRWYAVAIDFGVPELGAPPPDRLVADHSTAFEHEFLDFAEAEREPEYTHTRG